MRIFISLLKGDDNLFNGEKFFFLSKIFLDVETGNLLIFKIELFIKELNGENEFKYFPLIFLLIIFFAFGINNSFCLLFFKLLLLLITGQFKLNLILELSFIFESFSLKD